MAVNETLEIVCCTDSNYVMPTGVMLASLFENNRDEDIRVHLLHNGISDSQAAGIKAVAAAYGRSVCFYLMDDSRMAHFPIGKDYQNSHVGLSLVTYYRLLLPHVLPESVEKVIYLDADMIIKGSLRKLWAVDMEGKAVAAVPDSFTSVPGHYNRLRYPQTLGYFNAGLLVINLKYWRGHDAEQKFADYIMKYPERLAYHDQDVLNFVFKDVKIELPLRYNMLNEYWFDMRYSVVSWEFEEQIKAGQRSPVVVHFTAIPKPWYTNCRHPYKPEFERYKAMTPWRGYREKRWKPLKYVMERAMIKAVVALGLRKRDYIVENRYIKRNEDIIVG